MAGKGSQSMNIERAIKRFRRRFVGQQLRGQIVEDVEIAVETLDDDLRWYIRVYFRENPPTGCSPEQDLLERVFSDIPKYAYADCRCWREVCRVVSRRHVPDWRLEDEPAASPTPSIQ